MTSPADIHIRAARRDDVPAIAILIKEFADYMRELGDTSAFRFDAESLARDGFGVEPAFEGLVAEASGVVVGYLLHHPGYDTDAACRLLFVADLFVTRTARGQGSGAALMRAARAVAATRGAKQLVWTVDRRNVTARRFYEQLGAGYVDELALMFLSV